jgi:predicted ester cyclase
MTIDDMVVEGDKVVGRFTFGGTHTGDLMGIAPTGKKVEMTGISIIRVADGKFVEEWQIYDALGMMQQEGAIPK